MQKIKGFLLTGKGFTLIELLVVIAIIGLLASIVLVSLSGAQNRAKDARVMTAMNQFRSQAVIIGESNAGSFNNIYCSDVTGPTCTCLDTQIKNLCDDITQNASGSLMVIRVNQAASTTYCAYARLLGTGQYWCVDNVLTSKSYAATTTMCWGADYTCD